MQRCDTVLYFTAWYSLALYCTVLGGGGGQGRWVECVERNFLGLLGSLVFVCLALLSLVFFGLGF